MHAASKPFSSLHPPTPESYVRTLQFSAGRVSGHHTHHERELVPQSGRPSLLPPSKVHSLQRINIALRCLPSTTSLLERRPPKADNWTKPTYTASLNHLRTMLPESSSLPLPAKRPNRAIWFLFYSKSL